jgi:hypothetical protein
MNCSLVNEAGSAVTTGLVRFRHMRSAAVTATVLADWMCFSADRTYSRDVEAKDGPLTLDEFEHE